MTGLSGSLRPSLGELHANVEVGEYEAVVDALIHTLIDGMAAKRAERKIDDVLCELSASYKEARIEALASRVQAREAKILLEQYSDDAFIDDYDLPDVA